MSSTAPTTYSLSSATYGRPHSHHTAETSIDLSNASVPTNAKKFYGSKPGNKLSPHLSINGYVSSDSDSFLASQEDRSASEEDLLFTNGYGKNGMQLPGLGDTFAAPGAPAFLGASRSAYRRPSIESPQLSKSALQHTESDESLSLAGKSSRRKRSTKSAAPVSQRRNFQEEHGSRAQTFTKRYETKRLSALLEATTATGHSHYGDENASDSGQSIHAPDFCIGQRNNVAQQGVEEEKLEKLNIATAIRLRKEAKSKKRVSAMSVSSQSRGSGPVKTIEA
ncbi:hypothetical protein SEPCBS57363_006177 [Sporothrix epigloea]|uniref:Pal1 cell morphology protein n=1 Tax=Sporothrix epigloea TaxID=1892477 RepID=A0ABP0E5V6_9PEZI